MKNELQRVLNLEQYGTDIVNIIDDAESIITDPHESDWNKRCARMNAYDQIAELVNGERRDEE